MSYIFFVASFVQKTDDKATADLRERSTRPIRSYLSAEARGYRGEGGCPKCSNEMRIVALIDDGKVIERILRHLGLWEQGVRVSSARAPPQLAERVIEPWLEDPFPDYDTESVMTYATG